MRMTHLDSLLQDQKIAMGVEAFLAALRDASVVEIKKGSKDTRAWFVTSNGQSYFCKWVEMERYEVLLAKDVALCSRQLHPSIPRLLNVIQTEDGVLLVFEHVSGDSLDTNGPRDHFFALPLREKLSALRRIFGALAALVAEGWIMVDFYEGNVIYDFAAGTVSVFDFELFERGNGFTLERERNYGASRLMAPEEFVRGSWIDQRSNVYTLGRYAICALSARRDEEWRTGFPDSDALAAVLEHATHREREARFATVAEFLTAFEYALDFEERVVSPTDP